MMMTRDHLIGLTTEELQAAKTQLEPRRRFYGTGWHRLNEWPPRDPLEDTYWMVRYELSARGVT